MGAKRVVSFAARGMDDTTSPSHQIDALEARVVVFRQQPEAKSFAKLRQELRDAGRGELLAELCATWAQHERDPIRAADAWSEAGEAMVVLGETATAVEYLRTALELDPTNDRAADRLLEIVEPSDPAFAAALPSTSSSAWNSLPTIASSPSDA